MTSRVLVCAFACAVSVVTGIAAASALDIQSLFDEFNGNPAAFKQKYRGSSLVFTATVFSISLEPGRSMNPASGPEIELMGSNFATFAHCYLNDADKSRALSISKGDKVIVTGTFAAANVAGLDFAPCTFATAQR